jgi:streptogramin lyase
LLFIVALLAGAASPPSAGYTVDRWGVEEGLPNNALSSVIQTRDGYLWIGTWAGTVRFDGVRFTRVVEDLPNDHVRALLQDRRGALWIAVAGAGVVRKVGDSTTRFTPAGGLGGIEVRALAEDAAGRIWAASEGGLSVIESGRVTTYRRRDGLADDLVLDVVPGRGGRVFAATAAGVCEVLDRRLSCEPAGRLGRPEAVAEDRAGVLWMGGSGGLFTRGAATACASGCLLGEPVTALREARSGGVWAGLADGSVALLANGAAARYGGRDGLPTGGPAVTLYEDPEGSLWVGTYNGGLGRLRPKRVKTYTTADGLPAKVVGSIV